MFSLHPNEQIYFIDLAQAKDLLPLKQFNPKKWTIAINTQVINSSL
jgi:hypothetical protein